MGSFTSNSPDETFELGRQWAADLAAGWVIGLIVVLSLLAILIIGCVVKKCFCKK